MGWLGEKVWSSTTSPPWPQARPLWGHQEGPWHPEAHPRTTNLPVLQIPSWTVDVWRSPSATLSARGSNKDPADGPAGRRPPRLPARPRPASQATFWRWDITTDGGSNIRIRVRIRIFLEARAPHPPGEGGGTRATSAGAPCVKGGVRRVAIQPCLLTSFFAGEGWTPPELLRRTLLRLVIGVSTHSTDTLVGGGVILFPFSQLRARRIIWCQLFSQ